MKQIKSLKFEKRIGSIKWTMSRWCNYHCDYCIIPQDAKNETFPQLETLIEQGKELNNYIEKMEYENIRLNLIGGEVTFFDLETIFEKSLTSKKIKEVFIVTNLSNKLEYYTSLKHFLEQRNIRLHYSVSFHVAEVNNYQEFIKKVNTLEDVSISVVVNNENQATIKKILQILGLLEDKRMSINFDRLMASDKIDKEFYNLVAKNKRTVRIEYDDGEVVNGSREDLQKELGATPDFYSYKCKVVPSYEKGKFRYGACKYRRKLEKEGKCEEICVCKSHNCSFCDVIEIYK